MGEREGGGRVGDREGEAEDDTHITCVWVLTALSLRRESAESEKKSIVQYRSKWIVKILPGWSEVMPLQPFTAP